MRVFLAIACAVAITTNLLIPQQLVSYHACCYSADGQLIVGQCECSRRAAKGDGISAPLSDCCKPIITQLRDSVAQIACPAPVEALPLGMLVQPVEMTPLIVPAISPVATVLDTGPPIEVGFLKLHARFNI